jgi:hypothetical protein
MRLRKSVRWRPAQKPNPEGRLAYAGSLLIPAA